VLRDEITRTHARTHTHTHTHTVLRDEITRFYQLPNPVGVGIRVALVPRSHTHTHTPTHPHKRDAASVLSASSSSSSPSSGTRRDLPPLKTGRSGGGVGGGGDGGEGGQGRAPSKVEKGNNTNNANGVSDRVESPSLAVAIGSSIGSWVGGALLSGGGGGGDKSDKGDTGDQEKKGKEEGTQAAIETFGAEVVKFPKVTYYSVLIGENARALKFPEFLPGHRGAGGGDRGAHSTHGCPYVWRPSGGYGGNGSERESGTRTNGGASASSDGGLSWLYCEPYCPPPS
jgi:hypothetical protein